MNSPVIAFDPGGTTGFAALSEDGRVLFTQALVIDALDGFLELFSFTLNFGLVDVVIEIGPQFEHHSPITRRIEAKLRETFPKAHLVQPSEWKSHPASRRSLTHPSSIGARGFMTTHEKDAVRLAHWFQVRRDDDQENTTPADSSSTRRQRN